jgi:FkbM family methyltransferase
MIRAEVIRRGVRRYRLQRILRPLVRATEQFLLARLDKYEVLRTEPGSIEIAHRTQSYKITGLGETFRVSYASDHERPTMSAILTCVNEGEVVWDVGANIGFYSCLLSQIVGATGEVFAFEPDPYVSVELGHLLNACNVANVRALRLALSDSDGTVQMLTNPSRGDASRITSSTPEQNEIVLNIPARRGDSLVQEGLARQPSFVKLDVEGHELSSLSGMREVLSNPVLRSIVCEIHYSILDASGVTSVTHSIRQLLRDCGLTHQQWVSWSHLLARRQSTAHRL